MLNSSLPVLTHEVGSIGATIGGSILRKFALLKKVTQVSLIWLIGSAITDIIITISLVYYLVGIHNDINLLNKLKKIIPSAKAELVSLVQTISLRILLEVSIIIYCTLYESNVYSPSHCPDWFAYNFSCYRHCCRLLHIAGMFLFQLQVTLKH